VQLPPALMRTSRAEASASCCSGAKRDRIFPDTPTATEAGFPVALDSGAELSFQKTPPLT